MDYTRPGTWSLPAGGIRYRTTEKIDWGLGHPLSNTRLKIDAGQVFDVSVPRGLRWLFDPHDPRYRLAGLIHDELLHVNRWTRMRAGGEFHDALRAGGTPVWRALVMWLAVSVFRYPLQPTTAPTRPAE
jgi:hypothetical protein